MRSAARAALAAAFAEARHALRAGEAQAALRSLERAHILGQRLPLAHAEAHWLMLRAGWQARDWREVLGQLPRIVAALLFSRIWVPVGNSGRARVSAFQPMPLSAELKRLLE
ncbi:DUF3703 domain-containing protein [Pseudomonas sp. L-22-4S-12]|uniref:DUF3703 domain-containing protein n=1 Tax=Pseudomonas sp. L-22-4S-12 TaxID=2610893 RepID=UPI001320E6F3|nr:DUF3703 domain-containing protein [Pseudomonas sp. L-22-4S-12]MWV16346.1 DUF3703 domain-containing protein [Pseudomonas sp. L-22-4S-12]